MTTNLRKSNSVRWWEENDRLRGEILHFRGERLDSDEDGSLIVTLYETPGGYRVYPENDGTAYLSPTEPSATGELEYPTYTAEESVEEFPRFADRIGVFRVRDID